MSITATKDATLNTVSSIQSAIARGMRIEYGVIAFDSTMTSSGESITFDMPRCVCAFITPEAGYTFEYRARSNLLYAWVQDSSVDGALTAYSGTLAPYSQVSYVAFGF